MNTQDLRAVHVSADHWPKLLDGLVGKGSRVRYVVDSTRFTRTWRVTMIIVGPVVVGVAHVRFFGRPGTVQEGLEIREFRSLSDQPVWSEIRHRVPANLRKYTQKEDGAAFPDKTADAVISAIREFSPDIDAILEDLRARLNRDLDPSFAKRSVREQRDAIALGLEMAGIESHGLIHQDELETDSPALTEIKRHRVSEAAIIRHDALVLDDWIPREARVFDVAQFSDPADEARRMTVIYADKEALERLVGTDLIYFNEQRGAFTLVQYKRMRRDGKRKTDAVYYPDDQLREEIRRFEDVGAVPQVTSSQDWRLSDDAFFVKLVDEIAEKPRENRLVRGYYLPQSLIALLLEDAEVGRTRKGWTAEALPAYFSNDEFLMLARQGFIGTRTAATEAVRALVEEALGGHRAVLLALDHTKRQFARRPRHA